MGWTTPRSWAAAEVVTAALLNTHLRDNLLSALIRLDDAASTTSYDSNTSLGGSINQTFRSLLLTWQGVSSVAANEDTVYVRFNNDSGSNYDYQSLDVLNTTVAGSPAAAASYLRAGACKGSSGTSGKAGMGMLLIPSYTETTNHKVAVGVNFSMYNTAVTGLRVAVVGGLYRATTAISRVQLGAAGGNFTGRISLYGIPI